MTHKTAFGERPESPKFVRSVFRITTTQKDQLEAWAAKTGVGQSELVRRAIDLYIRLEPVLVAQERRFEAIEKKLGLAPPP